MTTKKPRSITKKGRKTTTSRKARGIAHGYRSGLEERTAEQIKESGLECLFETDKIEYTWPARQAKYTPDFKLPKPGGFYYVETKGRFLPDDRAKQLHIRDQRPDLDIRFVFSNANAKLYKGSPTSYAMWCDKHGFTWANKTIPPEWLQESINAVCQDDKQRT